MSEFLSYEQMLRLLDARKSYGNIERGKRGTEVKSVSQLVMAKRPRCRICGISIVRKKRNLQLWKTRGERCRKCSNREKGGPKNGE